MRQLQRFKLAILTAALAGAGCQWLPSKSEKKTEQQPLSIMGPGGALIGPKTPGELKTPQELDPKAASFACLAAASEMEKAGQTEEAIRLYEKARQDDPKVSGAISRRLGILYDKVGDFSKATVEYEIALKATPNDADLLSDIGYSYFCRKDYGLAEKHLRQATKVQANHKRAWTNLGMVLAAKSRWQESYDAFLMAVAPAEAHCNIAFCMAAYAMTDDAQVASEMTENAKDQYRKALDIDPGLQMARVGLNKLENPPTPEERKAAAKGPGDPTKITSIQEHMERIKASEDKARAPKKMKELEDPIDLVIPK